MEALHAVSWVFIGLGIFCFLVVYIDINMGRYQAMPIMNISWPITCIYSGPIGLYMYFKYGRSKKSSSNMEHHHCEHHKGSGKPYWVQIYISSTHCGAGCGAADIVSEILIYFAFITFWGAAIWASFFIDYAFALVFGLAFQYYNIKPMRPDLSAGAALWAAIKADVWSLTSFQVGMYGWMLAFYYMFDGKLDASSVIFWFMMQIGLTIGLFTTYPVNWLLIKWGVKVPCAH